MRRALVAGVVVALFAREAGAFLFGGGGCDRTDDDAIQASRVIASLTASLTAMEIAILAGLKLHATQVSVMVAQNANAFGAALDGANRARVEMLRDVEESRAVREHAPSETVCEGITGMSGLAPGRVQHERVAGARAEEMVGRMTQDPTVIVVSAQAGDARARFERVVQLYCDPSRTIGGEGACRGAADRHGADLHPGALLGQSTLDDGMARDTAADWMRNIAVPFAWDRMPYRAVNSEAELRHVLRERSFDARAALAGGYMAHLYGMRVPAVSLGAWARDVLPSGMGPAGDSVSHFELLEALTHRFEDPDYFLRLQAQGQANLLRELVQLRAVDLMLDWERYRLAEYQGAMTAALLAVETERDSVPGGRGAMRGTERGGRGRSWRWRWRGSGRIVARAQSGGDRGRGAEAARDAGERDVGDEREREGCGYRRDACGGERGVARARGGARAGCPCGRGRGVRGHRGSPLGGGGEGGRGGGDARGRRCAGGMAGARHRARAWAERACRCTGAVRDGHRSVLRRGARGRGRAALRGRGR